MLHGLLDDGSLLADHADGEHARKLERALKDARDEESLGRILRRFRQREMVRIAWRDLAGWAPLHEVLRDLTALADASVQAALARLGKWALKASGNS